MRRAFLAAVPLALAGGLTACDDAEPKAGSPGPAAPAKGFPALRVTTVVGGLDHPWDVKPIGRGRLLVTERDRARLSLVRHGTRHTVAFPSGKVWVSGETGLLGLAVDPEFTNNHRVYLCQGGFPAGGGHDVRVTAWRLHVADRKVTKIKTLVGHFPTSSGRHGGCRLLIARQRRAAGRHRRRRDRDQPPRPHVVRREDAAARPVHRQAVARQPLGRRRQPDEALRPHLGSPQRAGPGPARRRHAVVGRARTRPRRRGQPAPQRRRLRLEPGARLQRVGPDDRPVAARPPGPGPLEVRASRRWPPAAPTGCRSHGPRAGAPTAARSRSRPSRRRACCS